MTRPRPTEMTMSTTHYALRKLPKDYQLPKPSSYVPITNTDNSDDRCLYESKIYRGLMIPCPSSRFRKPSYANRQQENDDVYDQVDDTHYGVKEDIEDKVEYDYPENQNQDEYEEEKQPLNADEEFEQLMTRVKCKRGKCKQNNNNENENENQENENENQENEEQENENQENENENQENEYENEEENEEESPGNKEEENKHLPQPKPKQKPKPIPKPKGLDPKLKPLTVIHNYQPANFTLRKRKKQNQEGDEDKNNDDIENEEEEEEENSQESRLENVEEYGEGDELQDDEYYYDDDEEEYDQTPKKPKIPQKLVDIDNMKFNIKGDEASESIYQNTIVKNVSKTNNEYKPYTSESTSVNINSTPERPKPYDSAADAYTRIKDKKKPQDQAVMQMAVHETTVPFNLVDEQKNKYKLPTNTDSTTVSAKYRPRPTVRPNILKR